MFWNKKKESYWFDFDDNDIYPIKKRVFLNQENFNALSEKVDLILEHLKLEYVPEQYKTEPAKLTEQRVWDMQSCINHIAEHTAKNYIATKKAKKKQGRPRKK